MVIHAITLLICDLIYLGSQKMEESLLETFLSYFLVVADYIVMQIFQRSCEYTFLLKHALRPIEIPNCFMVSKS
jgi:hypothetical protein